MRQSIGKEDSVTAHKEARPATQAFVTETLAPRVQIAVGDAATRYSTRSHEATLLGLAPPSIERTPVTTTFTVNRPKLVEPERDDRRIATLLVLGTLIAMFSIALSAVPETAKTVRAPQAHQVSADDSQLQPKPETVNDGARTEPAVNARSVGKVQDAPNSKPALVRTQAQRSARAVPPSKNKPLNKVESRKRAKATRDGTGSPYPGARITE